MHVMRSVIPQRPGAFSVSRVVVHKEGPRVAPGPYMSHFECDEMTDQHGCVRQHTRDGKFCTQITKSCALHKDHVYLNKNIKRLSTCHIFLKL